MNVFFETEHLVVRELEPEDAMRLYENHAEEKVKKWFPNESYADINEARMRKIINHIRNHCLVPCLVASGKGYYVTTSVQEMKNFIESLNGRIEAITAMRDSMMAQLTDLEEED